jgi:hypothetical protein
MSDSITRHNYTVDRESLEMARNFANALYGETLELRLKELKSALAAQRFASMACEDMLYSTVRLYAQHIDHMVKTIVESLIEGYELHGVQLDEQLARNTIDEAMRVRDALLADCIRGHVDLGGIFTEQQFAEEIYRACRVSRRTVAVLVDPYSDAAVVAPSLN